MRRVTRPVHDRAAPGLGLHASKAVLTSIQRCLHASERSSVGGALWPAVETFSRPVESFHLAVLCLGLVVANLTRTLEIFHIAVLDWESRSGTSLARWKVCGRVAC